MKRLCFARCCGRDFLNDSTKSDTQQRMTLYVASKKNMTESRAGPLGSVGNFNYCIKLNGAALLALYPLGANFVSMGVFYLLFRASIARHC